MVNRTRLAMWAVAGGMASLLAWGLSTTTFLEHVEARSFDARARELGAVEGGDETEAVLVLVDEKTLAFFKKEFDVRWPFQRDAYCPVLRFLKASGARAVGFDIQFSEPDALGDEAFAACLAETGLSVLGYQCHADVDGPPAPGGFEVEGGERVRSAPCRPLLPVPPLRAAVKGFGAIDPTPDDDGVLRHVRPLEAGKSGFHGTLGVALWLAAHPGGRVSHRGDHIALGERRLPVGEDGQLLVRWRPAEVPFARHSFSTVFANGVLLEEGMTPELPLSTFKDKTVFLGTSAAATYEMRVTPVREADYGIHVHASVYESIVSGLHCVRAPRWLNALLLVLLTFAVAASAILLPSLLRQALVSLGLFAAFLASAFGLFASHGLWLDIVATSIGMFVAFSVGSVLNYLTEGRAKAQIRGAFQHYLSPDVIADLVADPSKLSLGGKRLEITAFFSDIAGFTTFSEVLEPTALVAFLNEYLTALTNIILEEGGTIDKYEGDAIIAMFGAPVEHADHAIRAVRATLRCQERLEALRPGWRARGLPEVRTRMGVNSGLAVVGNMGSEQRFDYTMIGDTVNLAARLEGTNKVYETEMMIGQGTARLCGDAVELREIDAVRVKGKHEPVRVYEPLGMRGEVGPEKRATAQTYGQALAAWRARDFATARALLQSPECAEDPPSRVLLARVTIFEARPPPPDWDGVFEMLTK